MEERWDHNGFNELEQETNIKKDLNSRYSTHTSLRKRSRSRSSSRERPEKSRSFSSREISSRYYNRHERSLSNPHSRNDHKTNGHSSEYYKEDKYNEEKNNRSKETDIFKSNRSHGSSEPLKSSDSYLIGMEEGRYGLTTPEENASFQKDVPTIDFSQYDNIPVEMSGRSCPRAIDNFGDMNLGRILIENIKIAGYERPTPVQKNAIPAVMADRDLMACAQTGSGKTAAFLFPIIAKLTGTRSVSLDSHRRICCPSALILAPTRELACQIEDECKKFCVKTGLRSLVVYGGSPILYQLRNLESYGADILVATPGRLVDIIEKNKISLSKIRYLVLDEADRMLDMGFEPQIRKIVEKKDMTKKGQRRTLMFSATFPKEIQQLAGSFLEDYIFLTVGRVGSTTDLVKQNFIQCEERDKLHKLIDLLRMSKDGLTLIFVEKKKTAENLGRLLLNHGFRATSIHGDRAQRDRTAAIRTFSTGETPYLVATNVAARGLDIYNVAHVVNYDMPNDIDDYVHRIGRTGRAGKKGISTTFISAENSSVLLKLLDILEDAGQEIPQWMSAMKFNRPHKSKGGHRFGGTDYRREGKFGGHSGSNYNNYRANTNAQFSHQQSQETSWSQGQQVYSGYGYPYGYSGYSGYDAYSGYSTQNNGTQTSVLPPAQPLVQPPPSSTPQIGPMRPASITQSRGGDLYKPY